MTGLITRGLKRFENPVSTMKMAGKFWGVHPDLLNYIVHVDPRSHTVYVETPKVACTAVKAFMQSAASGGGFNFDQPQHHVHDRERSPLTQIKSLTPRERRAVFFSDRYTRFSFVRHPTNRFVSAYKDKFLNLERERHLRLIGLGPKADPTMLEVLQRLHDLPDRDRDIHFATQHFLLGSGRVSFDFLGRFETFDEDLRTVAHRFYREDEVGLSELKEFGKRHSTSRKPAGISAEEDDLIRRIYDVDFREFGYLPGRLYPGVTIKEVEPGMEDISMRLGMKTGTLDYLVHVDPDHRTVYFETPSVADTSVKVFMQEALLRHPIDRALPRHMIHRRNRSPLLQLSGMDKTARNAALFEKGYSRFSFVRNPVDRFVSAYRDKYLGAEREMHLRRIGLDKSAEPTMLDVLERMKDLPDSERDIHFMSQHYLLGSGEIAFDFIGRYESFGKDLEQIASWFYDGRDVDFATLEAFDARHPQSAAPIEIGAAEEAIIRRMYQSDFDCFGYSAGTVAGPAAVGDAPDADPDAGTDSPAEAAAGTETGTPDPHPAPNDPAKGLFSQSWFRWKLGQGLDRFNAGDLDGLAQIDRDLLAMAFVHLLEQAQSGTGPDRDLVAFFGFALERLDKSHAQILQDLWVLFMTGEKRGGFFVEFGACDGVSISNTLLLEQAYGWSGILAEPNPTWTADLRRNRTSAVDTDCVFPVTGEVVELQCVAAEPELTRIATIVPDDVHEREGHRGSMELVSVPTVSLNDLLDRHDAPPVIDFMSVDTEGSEYEILKTFDFDRYDVKLFAIENAGETEKQARILDLMTQHGYRRWYPEFSRWDDWYYRP